MFLFFRPWRLRFVQFLAGKSKREAANSSSVSVFFCVHQLQSRMTRTDRPPGGTNSSSSTRPERRRRRKNRVKMWNKITRWRFPRDRNIPQGFPTIIWKRGNVVSLLMFHSNVLIIELSTKGEDPWKWISRQKLNNGHRDDTRFLLFF